MYEGETDEVRGWGGDSDGMHKGATDEVRGWEGDSEGMHEGATGGGTVTARVCMREKQMK